MEKTKNFFLAIDQFIFKIIDQIKGDSSFQKLDDLLTNMNDDEQKITAQVFVFLLILVPYLFVFYFFFTNYSLKKEIELKKEIIASTSVLSGHKDELFTLSTQFLSPNPIANKNELEMRLDEIKVRTQIRPDKLSVIEFNLLSQTSTISKISAKLQFHSFGTQDFSNLLREMSDSERFKIMAIKLNKNMSTNLLDGTIEFKHLATVMTY
jgi:hypothetical protein